MSVEETKAVALRYLDAFAAGDLAALDECVAPNYVRHDPGLPFEVRGPEGVKQLVTALRAGLPDFQNTIEDVIAEGDKVLVRLATRAIHRGELLGIPPTGKAVTVTVMDLFRVADRKIAEQWVARDDLGMMQQLGIIPAPGQAAADANQDQTT